MPKRDYYEVLSINRDATNSQIKAAYRRLALRWHPDKNPNNRDFAEIKFKEVSEAFSVLSDKNKRRAYDLYGHAGLESGTEESFENSGNFDFQTAEDIFRNFFGGRDPFEDLFQDKSFSGFNTDQKNDFENIFSDSRMNFIDENRIFEEPFNDSFLASNINQTQTRSFPSDSVYVRNEGFKQSIKTTIINRNERQFKKTETTITYPDGSQEVLENVEDDNTSGYLNH